MKMPKTIEAVLVGSKWEKEMRALREILIETELEEGLKWGIPYYMINNKNVIGMAGFNDHFALWFTQGVFLKDPLGVLMNAGEGKTKGLRQWRFTAMDQLNRSAILEYVHEAIKNQHAGLEIKPEPKKVAMPTELQDALAKDEVLTNCFNELTPGKRKEYAEHIGSAKQQATRMKRLEKCAPMIKQGIGLNDKYRNF